MGRLSAQNIREQEFKQSALGYNREQVTEFLEQVAEELETLTQEFNTLYAENKESLLALQTYGNVEESLKETLLLAQKTAQETMRNAQNEAETTIRKANTEKDALLFSAKQNLSEIQNEIQKLKAKREAMLIKLKSILNTNLEMLSEEFSGPEADDTLLGGSGNLHDERIIDFSKADLVVEDLSASEESHEVKPEVNIDESNVPEDE
ncbi:DivIVA domain-containing protein [bacterium]|nr:DivIVA domain-containing protein [bacterium]